MKRSIALVFTLMMGLMAGTVFASEKIAVVDMQQIMQRSGDMKGIQESLEKEFKPRRDKLISMEGKIKADMEKFKKEAAVMSKADQKKMQEKIISAQREFEQEGQKYQRELSAKHNAEMQKLYAKVRTVIEKVAKDGGYDLVLQKEAAPYVVNKLDLTDKVIKKLS